MKNMIKTSINSLCMLASTLAMAVTYPSAGTSTEPNVWTKNFTGVLEAAKTTGYPILLIVVNSGGCSHCHTMMGNTINTETFASAEKELTFYKVLMDMPYSYPSVDWNKAWNGYKAQCADFGMFPILAVLRKDGSVYGNYGNKTTDKRGVAAELRSLIENLAEEQGVDIDNGYVPPTDPDPVVSVSAWASKLKGKTDGLLFDANQDVAGSFTMKITAKGVVTAKISTVSGTKVLRGKLEAADDSVQATGGDMALDYNTSSKTWTGSLKGFSAFSGIASSAASDGLYTAGAESDEKAGYLTLSLKRGKGKMAGYLGGKNKISVSGAAVKLPAVVLSNGLDRWHNGNDLVFVPAVKRGKLSGGGAVSPDGTFRGTMRAFSSYWTAEGFKWTAGGLAALDGTVLAVEMPSGTAEALLKTVGGNKIAVASSDNDIKVSANARQGTFKGSGRVNGSKFTIVGALVKNGTGIVGEGVTFGAGAYRVTIGSPCGAGCTPEE